jgi:hypothetical protein
MSTKEGSPSSPVKPSPTAATKPNRLPAPTLFVGPPSRNASQLSISRQANDPTTGKPSRNPLQRQRSALNKSFDPEAADGKDNPTATPAVRKAGEKDVEAKWREMQSVLNEVELTAQSSTHVFGESHARALDDLRRAQVELARAWGRGNGESASQQGSPKQLEVNRFQGAEAIAADRFHKASAQRRRG